MKCKMKGPKMQACTEPETVDILGINVTAMNMDQVIDFCREKIESRSPTLLGVLNVAKAVKCRSDYILQKSLEQADIILPDGAGIVLLSRLLCCPLPQRVPGIDIMYNLLRLADELSCSVYFLGAKQEVVQKVVDIVTENYPHVRIAGFHDGYFDRNQARSVADDIRQSDADMLFVAMPTPKKEIFLGDWQKYMNVPLCHGVGGSFDVMAGIVKRAPQWVQNIGMEWFYRMIQEPRRLFMRYLATNSMFMLLGMAQVIKINISRLKRAFSLSPNRANG